MNSTDSIYSINILFGSSCVGKSTFMEKSSKLLYKVEMDDSEFWREDKTNWPKLCFEFLREHILKNCENKDMIVTCGGLPLPSHSGYKELESKYNIVFKHTLILAKDTETYISQIKKRKLDDQIDELIESYKWRETTIDLHHEIIINDGSNYQK